VDAIRPVTVEDADALAALLVRNREHLRPFEPERPDDFYSAAGQREALARREADRAAGTAFAYAILDGGDLAGLVSLSHVLRGALESANVGYWVDAGRNGRGLATRAVAAVAAEAFGPLGLHRLEAGTRPENLASQRVLEKNGFVRIGLAPRYLRIAGEWRDHVLYQRTADD
jgi:ribosomal-protein-alanine N-acetyltransferase